MSAKQIQEKMIKSLARSMEVEGADYRRSESIIRHIFNISKKK